MYSRIDQIAAAQRLVVDPDQLLQPALDRRGLGRIAETLVVVFRTEHRNGADGPLAYAMDAFDEERIRPRLEIDEEDLLVGRRLLRHLRNLQAAGDVAAQRLGDIDVPTRLDRRLDMLREAIRRRLQEDRVNPTGDELLTRRQTGEASGFRHTKPLARRSRHRLEVIGDRPELIASVLDEHIRDHRAPLTDANDAGFDATVGGRPANDARPHQRKGKCRRTGAGDKITTTQARL
jgi:hypothetical protein